MALPLELEAEQAPVVGHEAGALLVTGGAGTGKTSLLRERFAGLVEQGTDPERVALFTLSRRAARESRDWLVHRLRRSVPDLPVFTFHGFAYRLVVSRRFADLDYDEPPRVLSAPEQYAAVRDMLGVERREDWPHFGGLLGTPSFSRQVADFVLRCQERLLDPDEVLRMAEESGREDHGEVARFYRRYLDALTQAGQTDFAGLLFQAVSLLERGVAEEERFEHLLVDDYQDATPAAEAALGALAQAAESLVIAADPDGHVFGYRGGTLEALGRADRVFSPLRRVTLDRSHRLPGSEEALASLADPGKPAPAPGGGHRAVVLAHPGEEAEAVAHRILRWRVDDDIAWSDMAVVLRRYGPYLTGLRHALVRHRVPFLVVAEQAALGAEPSVRPIVDLLRFVFRPPRRQELLDGLLVSSVGGLDPHQLRRLRREARLRSVGLLELVESEDVEPPLPPELDGPVREFRALVAELPGLASREGPDGVFFHLWQRLPHFRRMAAEDGTGRELDALSALSGVLSRFVERRPGATVEDYLETLEAAEFGPDPWIPPEERHPDAVRIVSAHRAQGSEFEAVCVMGCLEGEFPSLSRRLPLVSLDHLVNASSAPDAAERLSEERALFRLAVSRARRETVLFASRSTGARNPRTPSRFAARLGLEWEADPGHTSPATSLRGLEAELRQVVSSSDQEPARRLAACAALGGVGARPWTWWGRREWSDPGTPLYEGPMRTSYSRLSTMENCALQYLYAVELGLDPDETYQMWVGTAVHRIIDRAQKGDLPRELEALVAELDSAWRPELFPNRAVEHRRYLDARGMLQRWLENEHPDPVMSEKWFEFPIDGATLRGRIDAIFRMNNGHLRVVDYKTGRSEPTKEQAKQDLQLATYFLAMKRDPELAALGEIAYLQLAFVGIARQREGFLRREVPPRTIDGYESWAEQSIRTLLHEIRAERFAPDPEANCRFCSFKTICPRWPEGRDTLAETAPAAPTEVPPS